MRTSPYLDFGDVSLLREALEQHAQWLTSKSAREPYLTGGSAVLNDYLLIRSTACIKLADRLSRL